MRNLDSPVPLTSRFILYHKNMTSKNQYCYYHYKDSNIAQTHMFERKVVIKKQRGGFKYKKNKTIYIFLFLPKAVFEHVYISTLPHSCTVVKQYKELTTKILSITFLILAFLTIHLGDHGVVNVLINLVVISHLLIKLLHLCLEDLLHGLLRESVHHHILREIVIHSNDSVAPSAQLAPYEQSTNANYTRNHRRNLPYMP